MANTGGKTTKSSSKTSNSGQAANRQPAKKTENERTPAAISQLHTKTSVKKQRNAIILMGIAVFLFLVLFIKGESLWLFLHNAMLGLLGFCAYLWPLLFVYLAIICAKDKPIVSVTANIIGASILIILLGGIIHILSNTESYFSSTGLFLQIKDAYADERALTSGGVLGALVGTAFTKLFGRTGAAITIILILSVGLMLLTGMTLKSLGNAVTKPVKKLGDLADEKIEKNMQKTSDRKEMKYTEAKEVVIEPVPIIKKGVVTEIPTEIDVSFPSIDLGPAPSSKIGQADSFANDFIIDEKNKVEDIKFPSVFATASEPYFDAGDISGDLASMPIRIGEAMEAVEKEKKERKKREQKSAEKEIKKEPETYLKEENDDYIKPPVECLLMPEITGNAFETDEIEINSRKLIETLNSFGVKARIIDVFRGPSVTRYELQPAEGVKISKITSLADDIALRLAASGVRIEAPIPNKAAIGIEVPNKAKAMVTLREIIDTQKFQTAKSKLNVALGKDITGNVICADLAKMPHLLIAGTTGSGKSVCLNTMILSLLYNATPDEVKLLMIDPKQVEFTVYNGIPHLLVPVVSDPRKAAGALGWAVTEMLKRYTLFSEMNVRDISSYNKLADSIDGAERMSQIVIFIDELSDLMMAAPNEVEDYICRLAQMARAAGMHLVIATQRPSVNVITGIIKANIPSRIALSVSSQIDSRTIIDMAGAEKLLGYGDMLFNPVGMSKPMRIQGCYVSEEEVEKVVGFIKRQEEKAEYDSQIMDEIEQNAINTQKKKSSSVFESSDEDEEEDDMLPDAIEVVVEAQQASTTLLQRKLKVGYARGARIIEALEEKGIIGPYEGSKPRKVLISKQQWMEMRAFSENGVPKKPYNNINSDSSFDNPINNDDEYDDE